LKGLLPRSALVSQQVEVGRGSVLVRLVSTENVPDARLKEAEAEIQRRSGRKTEIAVARIASQSELEELMQRLAASALPAPQAAPPEKTLAQVRAEVLARIKPALTAIWPDQAPLKDFDVAFAETGIVLNVQYEGTKVLDAITLDILAKDLQQRLQAPGLWLNATRTSLAIEGRTSAKRNGIGNGRLGPPSEER
jgi:hypothetical protein